MDGLLKKGLSVAAFSFCISMLFTACGFLFPNVLPKKYEVKITLNADEVRETVKHVLMNMTIEEKYSFLTTNVKIK